MSSKVLTPLLLALCTACSVFINSCNFEDTQSQTITWSALSELRPGEDASPLVNRLLNETEGNTKIIIPEGSYHFYPENAAGKYCIISNNDNGYYRIAFNLAGRKNISLDAQGSSFIFHDHIIPFSLEDSENLRLENFSVDWQRTFHSEAQVVNASPENNYFDISISDSYPYRIENNQLIWLEKLNENLWSKDEWRQDVGNNLFFDPQIGGTAYHVEKYKINPYFPLLHTQYTATRLTGGNIRISHDVAEIPKPGWIWVSKGQLADNRTSPAIRIFGCKAVELENINIHHAGAMGIIGERSENISLNNVNVILPEGKDRIVTTTADATHFVNCRGKITIRNSLFENMLDDATNIHGTYLRLDRIIDSHRVGITAVHDQQNAYRWAEEGDTLVFRNNETMEEYQRLTVKEYKLINEHYAEVLFHEKTHELKLKSGVENPAWYPEFVMEGCTGGAEQAIIQFEPLILEPEKRQSPFHRNIVIENNLFKSFDKPILHAYSVENLVFRDNRIEQSNRFKPFFPEKEAIQLEYSQGVKIEDNTGLNQSN